jgi:hypothetical protein
MRLAAQVKGGFYPCPPAAVAAALKYLRPAGNTFNLLDPCAGKGAAAVQVANSLGGLPWAIELDLGRADELTGVIDPSRCLAPGDAFQVRITAGSMQLLWLNPPYDDELGGGSGRVEHKFLMEANSWLGPGGVLVFCVPERIVMDPNSPSLEYLHYRYDDLRMMPYPEGSRKYREVFCFGVKRKTMRAWKDTDAAPPPPRPLGPKDAGRYVIPTEAAWPKEFRKLGLTSDEIEQALAASPLQKALKPPAPLPLARPPLPPGKGHMALLLAAGHLNGRVCPPGESPHVIRGVCRKERYLKEAFTVEKADGSVAEKMIEGENFVLTVRAVDSFGKFYEFK